MSFSTLLTETCTIETLTDGALDSKRNFVRTVVSADSPCRLVYALSTEPADGGVGVRGRWQLFLPAGTPITAASRVVVSGVRFRVDGAPNRVTGARHEHHVQAWLLEVSDVEGG